MTVGVTRDMPKFIMEPEGKIYLHGPLPHCSLPEQSLPVLTAVQLHAQLSLRSVPPF